MNYDDIVNPDIRDVGGLESRLVRMYLKKARTLRKPVVMMRDIHEYMVLRSKVLVENPDAFYMLVQKGHVLDMTPVVYHLLDTDEGLQYAVFRQLECQPEMHQQ